MKDIDEMIVDLKRELRDLDEESYIEKTVLYMTGPGKYSLEPEYSAMAMMREAHDPDGELEDVSFHQISDNLYIGYKSDRHLESEEEKTIIALLFFVRLDCDGYTEEFTARDYVFTMRFIESHMTTIITEDKKGFYGLWVEKEGDGWDAK